MLYTNCTYDINNKMVSKNRSVLHFSSSFHSVLKIRGLRGITLSIIITMEMEYLYRDILTTNFQCSPAHKQYIQYIYGVLFMLVIVLC